MNLCKEVCLRVVAHLWSTKLAHLSASQFKNSNLSSCNMRGQGKNVLKCVPTLQKWPNYLAHLAGYFCTCEYTNVPFWDKMAHLSGMFIYPAVHLCGVHCS